MLSVADRKLERLFKAPSWECCFDLSPDGHWLAYTSNLTGKFEVHLQAFQISENACRFLLDRTDAERPAIQIHVVINWVEELKQRLQ